MVRVLVAAAFALGMGAAFANDWKPLTPAWDYAPGTIQEDTVTPKQGEKFKRLRVWLKSTGKPLTVQVLALCESRDYEIVRLIDAQGATIDGTVSLDFPPGHGLFPLIEAVDRVCKARRTWWHF